MLIITLVFAALAAFSIIQLLSFHVMLSKHRGASVKSALTSMTTQHVLTHTLTPSRTRTLYVCDVANSI